ncbi:hypothetical protein K439DRAFT_915462 [Ramaria rubella]|nr:hypothetical protein K439DRAFT_915462 [Ramaria rubella]
MIRPIFSCLYRHLTSPAGLLLRYVSLPGSTTFYPISLPTPGWTSVRRWLRLIRGTHAAPSPLYVRRNSPPSSVFSQPCAIFLSFTFLKHSSSYNLKSGTNRYWPLIFIKPCTPPSSSSARRIKCTRATELATPVFQPLNHDAHEIARHL